MEALWTVLLERYRHWHGEEGVETLAKAEHLLEELSHAYSSSHVETSPRHALTVGLHLAEVGAPASLVCAALLHGIFARRDERAHRHFLAQEFGDEVVKILEREEQARRGDEVAHRNLEDAWHSLLDAAQDDVRILLFLLAHRLARLEEWATVDDGEERRVFAEETLRLYAPLAARLGVTSMVTALEDLSCRILYPTEYAAVGAKLIAAVERMRSRARAIEQDIRTLASASDILQLEVVSPRVAPLLLAGRAAEGGPESAPAQRGAPAVGAVPIPDVITFDVSVGTIDMAYRLVLLLHQRWKPAEGGFQDFVASPRPSGYQAIHTEVFTEQARCLFRIVTPFLHQRNTYGVALDLAQGEPSSILSLLSGPRGQDGTVTPHPIYQSLHQDVLSEQKVVYDDRRGHHSIPLRSTALDAAFLLYPEDAPYLRSIAVDGHPVSLSASVLEGAVVTFERGDDPQVRAEWLTEVGTSVATFAIQRALKRRSFEEKVQLGRRILQKQFDVVQSGLLVSTLAEERTAHTARTFGADSFNDVLARLAEGVISTTDLYDALFEQAGQPRTLRGLFEAFVSRLLHRVTLQARFAITGSSETCPDPMGTVAQLARRWNVKVSRETLTMDSGLRAFSLHFSCSAPNRAAIFNFLLTLEQELGFTSVRALLSRGLRLVFLGLTVLNVLMWLTPFLTLPRLSTGFSQSIALPLSLLPVAAANVLLFHYVRNYLTRFRESTQLFLAWGAINLVALCLFLLLTTYAVPVESQTSLLGLLALFVAATLLTTYQYLSMHSVFHPTPRGAPLTGAQWRMLKRRKIIGYTCRFIAVVIWGIQPLYLKYTPANGVDPFVRVFLMAAGILLISFLVLGIRAGYTLVRGRGGTSLRIPVNKQMIGIIVGAALFTYFLNASLRLTTSTNFILFNNVSPVLALLTAALLWRSSIPYLQDMQHMFWIFLIFLMGSAGSALLIYNSVRHPGMGSISGDIFGILAMITDTLYVVSQIRYMKVVPKASSPMINIYVFSALCVVTFPMMLYWYLTDAAIVRLAAAPVLFVIGAGILSGIGQILNYETFRRIDGFIAFLMFNISILITFAVEVLFMGKFSPTWVLLLGGLTIIGSTILAELINSRCEKKGL